jgi:hypothetical protein
MQQREVLHVYARHLHYIGIAATNGNLFQAP